MFDSMLDGNGGTGVAPSAEAAWRGLAALADWTAGRPTGVQVAAQLSRADAQQSAVAVRNLLHVILVDAEADPAGATVIEDVGSLLLHLQPPMLNSVLQADTDARRRVEFGAAAAARLPVPAVLRLAAGVVSAFDIRLSSAVGAAYQSLSRRVQTVSGSDAQEAESLFRDRLAAQFEQWFTPPRAEVSGGFEVIVERIETRAPGRAVPDAERLLEMSIECDVVGPATWIAVHEINEASGSGDRPFDGSGSGSGVRSVVETIKLAPESSKAAAAIMKRIATPSELRRLLRKNPLDGSAVDALLRGMGLAGASVMIDELVESTSRPVRRFLMERLAVFGPDVQALVEARLRDPRWFVLRNMLALLRQSRCPANLPTASRFLEHKDARVRREAVLWCLESPVTRDEGLSRALADRDPVVMRPALQAARSELPSAAVPILAKRVLDSDFPPEFRIPALGLLGRSGSALALEALLHFAQNGKTLFGKPRLASKSPEMLAAVTALARAWPNERRVAVLLETARRSRDREIASAARSVDGGKGP